MDITLIKAIRIATGAAAPPTQDQDLRLYATMDNTDLAPLWDDRDIGMMSSIEIRNKEYSIGGMRTGIDLNNRELFLSGMRTTVEMLSVTLI